MADPKFNFLKFLKDIQPPLARDMLWPMKSSALMRVRDIVSWPPCIWGIIEGGVCQGQMFTWNSDGSCNNRDVAFQLLTPEEREKRNQPT